MKPDLNVHFSDKLTEYTELINQYFNKLLEDYSSSVVGIKTLGESIHYSALLGGKRFRPLLALLTADSLQSEKKKLLAYGAAVEFIHTYSLIHDDLPCMDDDNERRGKPTNHKVYGEATALLAGDALLTESFALIAKIYCDKPEATLSAILELASAAGFHGMVGGQALDMHAKSESLDLETLTQLHTMKTGALIRASVVGAAHLCDANKEQIGQLKIYSEKLGLAFQIADDLHDHDPSTPEAGSFVSLLGLEKAALHLQKISSEALAELAGWGEQAAGLRMMVDYNLARKF